MTEQKTGYSIKQLTMAAYIVMLAGFITGGLAFVISVVMAHILKDSDGSDELTNSHLSNLITTFWVGLVLYVVGWFTSFILIGFIILPATVVWQVYRLIKGLMRLDKQQAYE